MKKYLILILVLISFKTVVSINARDVDSVNIEMSASAAILMDKESGRIIYQRNIHQRLLTASIAKIMTAIVAIENGDLNKYYEVTEEVTFQEGSSLYLEVGDRIKLKDLLYGLMLRSGNDAAYLIASSTFESYDEFIYMMNETAKKIGMKETSFSNPSGLDDYDANFSTCFDMAILMSYALDDLEFRKITKTKTYKIVTEKEMEIDCYNKHHLLHSVTYISGGKTGYTSSAKRTLVTSAVKDNLELIAVTLNSNNDDFIVHKRLFEYGFSNYTSFLVLKSQIIKLDNYLYKATPVVLEDIKYPVKEGERVECIISLLKEPSAKLIIGVARIYLNGKLVKNVNIYRYY